MSWSYRIARLAGIDVRIHVTFLLLLAWFGWLDWKQGGAVAAAQGTAFILLLFLCVLLHEFGHALAARVFGIRTPDITLLPIGGVARLERMPDKPWQELVVAVAGPAVNVVIFSVLFVMQAARFQLADLADLDEAGGDILTKLIAVNVMLVIFNAIPAFPMDGGRVLRSLLAMRLDYVRATTIAARVGQVMAALFVIAGIYGSPMLSFIGIFVFFGAQQELAVVRFRGDPGERRLLDVMASDVIAFPAEMPCGRALEIARSSAQSVFPVLGADMRALGVIQAGILAMVPDPRVRVDVIVEKAISLPDAMPLSVFERDFPAGSIVLVENAAGQFVGVARRAV